MKEIKAVIQSSKLQKVHDAFHPRRGFPGVIAARVEWCSTHECEPMTVREELTDFSKKVLLMIVAPDEMVEQIIGIIMESTSTGQPSDGLIWTTPVDSLLRICDGKECLPFGTPPSAPGPGERTG